MPRYTFITGEKFSVRANDAAHAKSIIDAYFSGVWEEGDDVYVTEDDINDVLYIENDTIMIDDEWFD